MGVSIIPHCSTSSWITASLASQPARVIGHRSCLKLRLRLGLPPRLQQRSFTTTSTHATDLNITPIRSVSPNIDYTTQSSPGLSPRRPNRLRGAHSSVLPRILRPNRPVSGFKTAHRNGMSAYAQLTSVPAADTPQACLSVRCGPRQYIFGRVAEGTQRSFNNASVSFSGTREVFLSGAIDWNQQGGLLGYLLSVGGASRSAKLSIQENEKHKQKGKRNLAVPSDAKVGLHAAPNLCHTMAISRGLIFRQPVWLEMTESRDDPRGDDPTKTSPDWEDAELRVWKVPVTRERSSSPLKRRRLSSESVQTPAWVDGVNGGSAEASGDKGEFKAAQTLSDPEVSKTIIEKFVFNGDLNMDQVLPATTVGELKPTDVSFIKDKGVMKIYRPSDAIGSDVAVPEPKQKAWIIPEVPSTQGSRVTKSLLDTALFLQSEVLPPTTYSDTSMSYIAKFPNRRGKFDPVAAKALGVKPPQFKVLTDGRPVTTDDGTVVQPEQVLGAQVLGTGFIVADIASRDYLDSFMNRPEWRNPELMANVAIMYWLLGPGLYNEPRIQNFIKEHPTIKHMIMAPETCPNMITNASGAEMQTMLHRVDPERFPLLNYDNTVSAHAPATDSSIEFGRLGHTVTLMPRIVYNEDAIKPFPDLATPALSVPEEILAMAEEARSKATDPALLARIEQEDQDIPNRDAEVVALGTGSSMPSKMRNVSGTLLLVPGVGNYLFDCGEGTTGQIRRMYGDERTAEIFRDLRCVVISHIHADHHLGCISVIREWYEQALRDGRGEDKLAISCIGRYRQLLEEFSWVEDFGFHRLAFPSCPDSLGPTQVQSYDLAKGNNLRQFNLTAIRRVPVPHCWRAMGTELKLTSGLRVAYSGDCRPSSDFAAACRGAHLLIHEGTFSDDEIASARAKMHSTVSEALGVAEEMQARLVLLTHFSQRYSKSMARVSGLAEDKTISPPPDKPKRPVLFAFDFMSVKLGDFKKAECYIPAIEALVQTQQDE